MKNCFIVISVIYFGGAYAQNDTKCTCVPYYLCDRDRSVITDGHSIVEEWSRYVKCDSPIAANERSVSEHNRRRRRDFEEDSVCSSYMDVCCTLKNQTLPVVTTKPSTVPRVSETPSKCGFRNPKGVDSSKKANLQKNETEFGEFPWMMAVQMCGQYRCGASLIHPSVVLTAAHCVDENATYTVIAGEWDTRSTNEVYKRQSRTVSSIKIHEGYNRYTLTNAIALLFLESPFTLAPHINLTCLPPPHSIDDSSRCFVAGWGRGEAEILKKATLPMLSKNTCQENLRKTIVGMFFQLHPSLVCAGGDGTDACIGDGGAPLMCPIAGAEGKYQQTGIVSWVLRGCRDASIPVVYTDVAFVRDWIDQQMKSNNYDTSGYQY